jgi:hypothetical protein
MKTITRFLEFPGPKERQQTIEFYNKLGYKLSGWTKFFNSFWMNTLKIGYPNRIKIIFTKED